MNNFEVKILNPKTGVKTDATPYAVFPLKVANLLDEQLDEANLTLKGIDIGYLQPFTEIEIKIRHIVDCVLTDAQYSAIVGACELSGIAVDESSRSETLTLTMVVANDRAVEVPVGSGRYNHEVYLIERTKLLERFIGDSITFSNPLGSQYSSTAFAVCNYESDTISITPNNDKRTFFSSVIKQGYIYGNTITLPTASQLEEQETLPEGAHFFLLGSEGATSVTLIKQSTNEIIPATSNNQYNLEADNYKITYSYPSTTIDGSMANVTTFEYSFGVFTNRLPLKKWTITSVINRIYDLIEPLEYPYNLAGTGNLTPQQPRFVLDSEVAEKYDNVLAPEFPFTRSTLREMLQLIGGFIHAEPRILGRSGEQYIVGFDEYGSKTYSNISKEPYVNATFSTDINQYCTALDSSADNLTNTLDWAQGVVVEPYSNGSRTLRTETTTTRLAEDNSTFIATQLPIHTIYKLEWYDDEDKRLYDITPYLFEASDYATLSSYQGAYPFTKAYAIYYTQGQKNVRGLFFKAEHAINPVFHEYAIINILRAVTENSSLEVTGQDLMQLQFRITYKPFYSTRVRTHKQVVMDGTPSTLAYNQGANAIETRYYGENLKGVVARLGNVEKTYTYELAFLSQIPQVGRKFDNNYYISNVTYDVLPFSIKCTVALSKHFNRISEYVGVNTEKRMWEISERQTQLRQSVFTSYIVASTVMETYSENTVPEALRYPVNVLFNTYADIIRSEPVSYAVIKTKDYNNNAIHSRCRALPVVASAFGNAMTFTFAFEDNYSAGQKIVDVNGDSGDADNVSGWWGDYVPYTDYYGRAYFLEYMLMGWRANNLRDADMVPNLVPEYTSASPSANGRFIGARFLYRKDSREIPQITHEIAVLSDNEDIIIGSALCRNCSAVNTNPKAYAVYLLPNRISLLDGKIDLSNADEVPTAYVSISGSLVKMSLNIASEIDNYKAWAVVTVPASTTIDVEDEEGNATTQPIQEGGELLLGRNFTTATEANQPIYFNYKRKIN